MRNELYTILSDINGFVKADCNGPMIDFVARARGRIPPGELAGGFLNIG